VPPPFFEDFAVGQRRLLPIPGQSFTPAAFAELFAGEGELTDLAWHHVRATGTELAAELVVTRRRRTPDGDNGVVQRHLVVRDQRGETVHGRASVLLPARDRGPDQVCHDFGTVAWGEALTEGLDDDFTRATASWDGTVGLRCGEDEVHLRIYRGRLIEVTRRAPLGATFVLGASELTWTELVTGPANDFMRRAMRGEFEVSGNGYEYLRLTRVLALLVQRAREVAR
jgi:putative sterol carrier protein